MNIIEMARQARFFVADNEVYSPSNQADHELTEFVKAFAALVEAAARADEREACIKLVHEGTGEPIQTKLCGSRQKLICLLRKRKNESFF